MNTFYMVRNLLNTFISNNYLSSYKMDFVKTQTNMGKECLIVDGYTFRRDSILKSGEISWRCSLNRQKCKAKIRTDADSTIIVSGTLDHNHPASDCPFFYIFSSAPMYTFSPPHCIVFCRPILYKSAPTLNADTNMYKCNLIANKKNVLKRQLQKIQSVKYKRRIIEKKMILIISIFFFNALIL